MLRGEYLTTSEVAMKVGTATHRKPPHRATILRWVTTGITTPGGRVQMAAIYVGGRLLIEAAELDRFLAACAAAKAYPPQLVGAGS